MNRVYYGIDLAADQVSSSFSDYIDGILDEFIIGGSVDETASYFEFNWWKKGGVGVVASAALEFFRDGDNLTVKKGTEIVFDAVITTAISITVTVTETKRKH